MKAQHEALRRVLFDHSIHDMSASDITYLLRNVLAEHSLVLNRLKDMLREELNSDDLRVKVRHFLRDMD